MSWCSLSSECLPLYHKNGENNKELAVIEFLYAEKDRVALGIN